MTIFDCHSSLPPMRELWQFDDWLIWRICRIESHEAREFLQCNGEPLFNPHADGADKYEFELQYKKMYMQYTEQQKLDAALSEVSSSILHGWTIEAKIEYIKMWLPNHYEVKESKRKGNVHCKSNIGISDDEKWGYFMASLKLRFPKSFIEVFHNTCHNHVDFTVYFKQ